MTSNKKSKIFIIDTSAVLSGKQITDIKGEIVTTPGVSNELKPGGRDYQTYQFLIEKGLKVISPSKDSVDFVNKNAKETGDHGRLSSTDVEVIALALDLQKKPDKNIIILTDDYSIQNLANHLKIKFESISQDSITKRFKWIYRCQGCGKKFKEHISVCPICGAKTKKIVSKSAQIY
jgi:UPF0271 protein